MLLLLVVFCSGVMVLPWFAHLRELTTEIEAGATDVAGVHGATLNIEVRWLLLLQLVGYMAAALMDKGLRAIILKWDVHVCVIKPTGCRGLVGLLRCLALRCRLALRLWCLALWLLLLGRLLTRYQLHIIRAGAILTLVGFDVEIAQVDDNLIALEQVWGDLGCAFAPHAGVNPLTWAAAVLAFFTVVESESQVDNDLSAGECACFCIASEPK